MSFARTEMPEWAYEFHGHRCPFMPIGFRMGRAAMDALGVGRVSDHGVFALVEIGIGHPQTCMADGVMVATGCTYGKLLMERLGYGKMALILYAPGQGARRVYLRSEFQDALGAQEFFAFRKRGVEPSEIPREVTDRAVEMVLRAPEAEIFQLESLPEFRFSRPRGSFARVACSRCREYVFERYARFVNGQPICLACSGFVEPRLDVLQGTQ